MFSVDALCSAAQLGAEGGAGIHGPVDPLRSDQKCETVSVFVNTVLLGQVRTAAL